MGHPMGSADAAWLHMDRPTNLMMITSALWFDEPVDEERLRAVVGERLVARFPRFRQRVVEGLTGPAWEDVKVDLDLHIHHLALPAPGDRQVLERVAGELMSAPLDRAIPLWSIHLFDGYGDGCAIVVRMHHAIADGIALARVMLGLTDAAGGDETGTGFSDPAPSRSADPLTGAARTAARAAGTLLHEATEALLHPSHLLDLAREGGADAAALTHLLTAPAEREHALHRGLGIAHRAAWSDPLPLDAVKATAHRYGVTVNDVLVACVAGAARVHFERLGEPLEDIRAMVPFNLRPLDQPLPRDLGNRFGLVLLELPVSVADPLERLHEASWRMRAIKRSREGVVSYGILDVMGRTPVALESRIVDLFSSKATMVLTNVPGPREPIFMAGARVGGVLVWAPCSGAVGMSVSIFSYDGEVTVGFMVNGRLVDDASVLVGAFEAAAAELLALPAATGGTS